jgi:hypothetical protein
MVTRITVAVLGAALLAPAAASAGGQDYPPPGRPEGRERCPSADGRTLRVGPRQRYRRIQQAVNAARPGDRIRIANGTYREGVRIVGSRRRCIQLVGNPDDPQRVVLDGRRLRGSAAQNGIIVNNADNVVIRGIKAQNYRGNGFFAVNVSGYVLDRLIAERTGTYGLYAFNSEGGSMTNSLSYLQADGGFYVGQTPPQPRPLRTTIRNVVAWGNVAGFTGTNMRYVTISRSRFFNNAIGIVPNALDSERFPPQEDNVVRDNDVFWNNFDVYAPSAPFRANRSEDFAYPPGIGVILLSGRRNIVEGNRIFGNWLSGFIGIQNPFLEPASAQDLISNRIAGNRFGLDGRDRNGRDLMYTGNGTGNCFGDNAGVETTVPAGNPSVFPGCPFTGQNTANNETLERMVEWAVQGRYREGWIQQPHAPVTGGLQPLVDYQPGRTYGPRTL